MADIPISIKPEREYLHEILKHMHSGEYAVPLFQRDYVWNQKQILDLFDSISKGYPIGSILLWRPKNRDTFNLSKNIITDETFENQNLDYYILDGRQRLTTFYRCLYDSEHSDDIFDVRYNLETEQFEYSRGRHLPCHIVKLPDLYDTFRLLDKLQEIQEQISETDKAKEYIKRAKTINSKFQSYQIGELLFENYTLDEAGTVFARINSKGTDISKVSMLQALFYKEGQGVLFSEWVSTVKSKLGRWGFDKIREEDILNCCYRYSGLNFYDNDLMGKIDKLDFINNLDEIERDLLSEAEFLHEECGILKYSMLPYARQWVILACFFKEKKEPTLAEKKELKKWVYYTGIRQTFMNGSMSIVRNQARRFEKFINGEESTAADYEKIKLPTLKFRYRPSSALSSMLMIALAHNYSKVTGEAPDYLGEYKMLAENNAIGIIPYFKKEEIEKIYLLMEGENVSDINLNSLGLTTEIIEYWNSDDKEMFETLRMEKLIEIETSLLESVGLEIEN